FTISDTSSALAGKTTISGRLRIAAVPSKPYGIRSSGSVSTCSRPTMATSSALRAEGGVASEMPLGCFMFLLLSLYAESRRLEIARVWSNKRLELARFYKPLLFFRVKECQVVPLHRQADCLSLARLQVNFRKVAELLPRPRNATLNITHV